MSCWRRISCAHPLTTVAAGSTVTWTNRNDEPHTVMYDSGLLRSGALDTNERFSFRSRSPEPATTCSIRPRTVGTINQAKAGSPC